MDKASTLDRGALAARGCIAIAVGVLALTWPGLTVTILIVGFAIYAIIDGILAIASGVGHPGQPARAWPAVIEGLFGLAVGVLFLVAPAPVARLVFLGIGLWALATGVMQLVEAPQQKLPAAHQSLAMSGVVRVLIGILLVTRPHAGLRGLVWLIAAYAFVEGFTMLGWSLSGRRGPVTQQPA
jgi:uncharacterized membrane protein HdeD (DUF308 family)